MHCQFQYIGFNVDTDVKDTVDHLECFEFTAYADRDPPTHPWEILTLSNSHTCTLVT